MEASPDLPTRSIPRSRWFPAPFPSPATRDLTAEPTTAWPVGPPALLPDGHKARRRRSIPAGIGSSGIRSVGMPGTHETTPPQWPSVLCPRSAAAVDLLPIMRQPLGDPPASAGPLIHVKPAGDHLLSTKSTAPQGHWGCRVTPGDPPFRCNLAVAGVVPKALPFRPAPTVIHSPTDTHPGLHGSRPHESWIPVTEIPRPGPSETNIHGPAPVHRPGHPTATDGNRPLRTSRLHDSAAGPRASSLSSSQDSWAATAGRELASQTLAAPPGVPLPQVPSLPSLAVPEFLPLRQVPSAPLLHCLPCRTESAPSTRRTTSPRPSSAGRGDGFAFLSEADRSTLASPA